MAKNDTPDTQDAATVDKAREEVGVAGVAANAELEHTRGGATTRDGMDAGVPMLPGQPDEPVGPEDAIGPGPKRGDYSDRVQSGPPMVTQTIPEEERQAEAEKLAAASDGALTAAQALGDVPATRLVPAATVGGEQGDSPGKGGVSTPEAREAAGI